MHYIVPLDIIDCGTLSNPTNGNVALVNGDTQYGAIATYSCNSGYTLNGTTDRQCLSNGQWNASNPTCDIVDCGDPGAPDNGQAHGNIYTYTSIVTFSCNTGYNLSNNHGIECLSNGQWNASNPTCDPVDCGNPGAPENGQAHGNIYTYTSIVTFSCNTGYNLSNNHGIECLSNRQWNASNPTCDIVDCGNPGAPDNGQAQGNIYTYTSIVTFSCNIGYDLSNNHGIECLSDGQWNASNPTCDIVDCGDPGAPDNGQAHGNVYTYTSIVTFSCNIGYDLSNNHGIECLFNGHWNASNPTCDPVDCGNPGAPENGQAHGNVYTYTSIVTFSCNIGYDLSKNHGIECLSNGQWNASNPTCDIVDCGNPGAPEDGQAHGNVYTYTSIVTFSCNTGYDLSNNHGIECLSNRQWNASNPTCDIVDCGDPGAPDNGQAHGNVYTYTSIVTFSCNIGYDLSNNHGIECLFNGYWNASNPTCDPVDCGNPGAPENGQAHGDVYTYNSVINYTCNEGYLINGSHSIVCLPSGHWNGSRSTCNRG